MFEQFFMYWLLWIILIIIVFFLEHSYQRKICMMWVLSIICLSTTYTPISYYQVSVALIMIFLGALVYIVEDSYSLLQLIRAFVIMITYCSLLIWEIISPVWFVVSSYFIIPVLIVALALLLNSKIKKVYAFMFIGITLGQVLFDCLLIAYSINDTIGMIPYFIMISLSVLLLLFVHGVILVYSNTINVIQSKLS